MDGPLGGSFVVQRYAQRCHLKAVLSINQYINNKSINQSIKQSIKQSIIVAVYCCLPFSTVLALPLPLGAYHFHCCIAFSPYYTSFYYRDPFLSTTMVHLPFTTV